MKIVIFIPFLCLWLNTCISQSKPFLNNEEVIQLSDTLFLVKKEIFDSLSYAHCELNIITHVFKDSTNKEIEEVVEESLPFDYLYKGYVIEQKFDFKFENKHEYFNNNILPPRIFTFGNIDLSQLCNVIITVYLIENTQHVYLYYMEGVGPGAQGESTFLFSKEGKLLYCGIVNNETTLFEEGNLPTILNNYNLSGDFFNNDNFKKYILKHVNLLTH
jgi:hypothetical protein